MKTAYLGPMPMSAKAISQHRWPIYLIITAGMAAALLMGGCAKQTAPLPPLPPKVVEAAVVVPVPCEIAQVPVPDYPARQARPTDDVFTLAKIALADRRVLKAEVVELRAANQTPCPGAAE